MIFNERIDNFLAYVIERHEDQLRDNGIPYVTHPIFCAMLAIKFGYDDPDQVMAILGHDLFEDTKAKRSEVLELSNERVLHVISLLTKTGNDFLYYRGIESDPLAVVGKVADRYHNLLTMNKAGWTHEKMARYYDSSVKYVLPLAKKTRMRNAFTNLLIISGTWLSRSYSV
jgi:GTP pyrophosphokinase